MLNAKHLYLPTLSLALTMGTGAAWGQAIPDTTAQAAPTGGLEEIVVTAEKRAENLQKAPLAVTALDSDFLQTQRIVEATDLVDNIPDIHVNGTAISIRGLGTSANGPQSSPGVAVHEDGIYLPGGLGPDALFDLARVEVDPGPQGTLYGRSAAAGAINFITNHPVIGKYEAAGSVEAGSYGLFRPTGVINVPLADGLALRAAFQSEEREGFYSDGYDDLDNIAGRLQVLWHPNEQLSIRLGGDYEHTGGVGTTTIARPFVGNVWNDAIHPLDQVNQRLWGVNGELNYDMGWANITVLPGYHVTRQDNFGASLSPGNIADTNTGNTEASGEARLASDGDTGLKWLGGIYLYSWDAYSYITQHFATATALSNNPSETQDSYAVFGQGSYPVLDRLRLTVGLRYTIDDAADQGRISGGPSHGDTGQFAASGKWYALNWKVGLDYDLTDTAMVYTTVSTGYKPGGVNAGQAPNLYAAERVTHFELGTKSRFLSNRLQINDAAYYDDYSNYQSSNVQGVNPVSAHENAFLVFNAAHAYIYGNELSVSYLLTDNDRVDVAANYLHGTFNTFVVPGFFSIAGPFVPPANYGGNRLPLAAEWTGHLGYQHIFDLASGAHITPRISTALSGSYFAIYQDSPSTKQAAFTRTELNATYDSPDAQWSVEGYIKNLENAVVLNGGSFGPPAAISLDDPRTFGVVFSAHF